MRRRVPLRQKTGQPAYWRFEFSRFLSALGIVADSFESAYAEVIRHLTIAGIGDPGPCIISKDGETIN